MQISNTANNGNDAANSSSSTINGNAKDEDGYGDDLECKTAQDNSSSKEEVVSIMHHHYPQAESTNMPWQELWNQMKKSGWVYSIMGETVYDEGLWIYPCAAKLVDKSTMIRKCAEGVHHSTTMHSIRRYAMNHLGWSGECTTADKALALSTKKRRKISFKKWLASSRDLDVLRMKVRDSRLLSLGSLGASVSTMPLMLECWRRILNVPYTANER